MHEASIVDGMLAVLRDHAAQHGVDRIRRVTVRVGQLKAVEPKALLACFAAFAENTVAAGAELVIEHVPVRAHCEDCGEDSEIIKYRFRCTRCQGRALSIISGDELYIESFEY
jgi:hydrogenase nickel incorporation protein HypA/HybF